MLILFGSDLFGKLLSFSKAGYSRKNTLVEAALFGLYLILQTCKNTNVIQWQGSSCRTKRRERWEGITLVYGTLCSPHARVFWSHLIELWGDSKPWWLIFSNVCHFQSYLPLSNKCDIMEWSDMPLTKSTINITSKSNLNSASKVQGYYCNHYHHHYLCDVMKQTKHIN